VNPNPTKVAVKNCLKILSINSFDLDFNGDLNFNHDQGNRIESGRAFLKERVSLLEGERLEPGDLTLKKKVPIPSPNVWRVNRSG
jgi:hypothetical protein